MGACANLSYGYPKNIDVAGFLFFNCSCMRYRYCWQKTPDAEEFFKDSKALALVCAV